MEISQLELDTIEQVESRCKGDPETLRDNLLEVLIYFIKRVGYRELPIVCKRMLK